MSNNEIDLMNEDSRTNKFRRERTVVQFGGNTKYGANIDYEEPQQMVFNDVLNLEEKYKEQTKEDIEFYQELIRYKPGEVREKMPEIKEKMLKMGRNPVLGDLYASALNQLGPYIDDTTMDELLIEKAKNMYEVNSSVVDQEWDLNKQAYEKYIRASTDDNLPISSPYNIIMNREISRDNSKKNALAKAYDKAKQQFINENTYYASDRDPDAMINVKANKLVIVDKNGEKIEITNREYNEFLKDYNKKNGIEDYSQQTTQNTNNVESYSVEDDDELVSD